MAFSVQFTSELWEHSSEGGWHFVTVPPPETEDLKARGGARRGFGSLRVRARVGDTSWETSVFPATEGFVLPVKKPVRKAEGLEAGELVTVRLELI